MIFDEVSFKTWCLLIGGFQILLGVAMLVGRGAAAMAMKRFPRYMPAGVALSTIAFLWAAAIVHEAPLDFIAPYRLWVVLALVVSAPLSWFWMKQLLPCRALGGIMVLLPAPVLLACRMVDSQWRLVLVTMMYVCAIAGMDLIMAPYHGRDFLAWLANRASRQCAAGVVLVALGAIAAALPFLA